MFLRFFQLAIASAAALILTMNTSKDVVSRKDVPFGVPKNYKMLTLFSPKNAIIWAIFDGTENFGSKLALTWETLSINTP